MFLMFRVMFLLHKSMSGTIYFKEQCNPYTAIAEYGEFLPFLKYIISECLGSLSGSFRKQFIESGR